MEHRAFLYGASADAPQGVSKPPVRREISQWGRGPFGGTIEDIYFPKLQLNHYKTKTTKQPLAAGQDARGDLLDGFCVGIRTDIEH